jgi:uncharacterized membrane protein
MWLDTWRPSTPKFHGAPVNESIPRYSSPGRPAAGIFTPRTMGPLSSADVVSLASSVAVLLGYHLFLRLMLRRNPLYTTQATNALIRARWVEGVLAQNNGILGVQTLRNSTMAATFLASTSVILVMGILNLITKGDPLASPSGVKLMLVLLDLFVGFFCFAMSIRLYQHVGYMLGIPGDSSNPVLEPRRVAQQLNRAALYYSSGMRVYYLLIPAVFWMLGPWPLFIATLGTLGLLFSYDRAALEGG